MCALFTMPTGSQLCFEGARIGNYLEQIVKQNPETLIWFSQFQAIFMYVWVFTIFILRKRLTSDVSIVQLSISIELSADKVTSRACASELFFCQHAPHKHIFNVIYMHTRLVTIIDRKLCVTWIQCCRWPNAIVAH